ALGRHRAVGQHRQAVGAGEAVGGAVRCRGPDRRQAARRERSPQGRTVQEGRMSITDRLLAAEKQTEVNRPVTVVQRSAVLDDLKKRSVESLFRRIGARINDASLTDLQLRDFVRAELEMILQEEHVQLGASERAALTL